MCSRLAFLLVAVLACGCGSGADGRDASVSTSVTATDGSGDETSAVTTAADATTDPDTGDGGTATDTGSDCLFCNAPNQVCIDDMCVTTCQGQSPDPCGPDQVCDVISGECRDPEQACTLAGDEAACGDAWCGPGSVCDGVGSCVPIPPCADVACTDDGHCWGTFCTCTRAAGCSPPDDADLNGPFSQDIGDLAFADDCTAWMVTLRSGTDYVRRLTPAGVLDEWPGVANLNMGEISILKSVTPPGITRSPGLTTGAPKPVTVEGIGEVAITYTCCSTCGCQATPPQGVARLVEDDPVQPLPLVIEATITQGDGPFGNAAADAGPMGLTWGIDRVLYVGNSTQNGAFDSADLELRTQANLTDFPSRITAAAPVSKAHLLVATLDGQVSLFNVNDQSITPVAALGHGVTSLSHDAFSGLVYAGLANLDIVVVEPFTGTVTPFDTMPGVGRVSVSPDGRLWFTPIQILEANAIVSWNLPDEI